MSLSILCAIVWAFTATVTALLPMRYQFLPGLALLIAAPVVILFLSFEHGALVGVLALAGFVSMFRRPLMHLWKKAIGRV